jgi:hypothetical protein
MVYINVIVCTLNVIIPGVYAWAYTIDIQDTNPSKSTLSVYFTATSINLLLQILSLCFLSSALYQIKYQINNKSILTINENAMCLHYACFVFFMVATIVFYVADCVYPPPTDIEVHLVTEIIKIISSVFL